MRVVVGLVVLLSLAAPGHAVAQGMDFETILRAYDSSPTRTELEEQWPDAHDRLVRAARGESSGYARDRAVAMLGMYAERRETKALLHELVRLPKGRVRGAAILTWARNYGRAGTAIDAEPVLEAARTWTGTPRILAIHALRFIVHPSANGTLRLLAHDDDPRIAAIASRVITLRERFLLELGSPQPRPTTPVPTGDPVGPTGAPRP